MLVRIETLRWPLVVVVSLSLGGCNLNPRPEDPGSSPQGGLNPGIGDDRGSQDTGGSIPVIAPAPADGGPDSGAPDGDDAGVGSDAAPSSLP